MPEDVAVLEKGGLAVEVSPLGGAILSARWHGIPILAPTATPGLASRLLGSEACFPLVPFGNRIEGNSFRFENRDHTLLPNTADALVLHGDGWLRRWSILRQNRSEITFRYAQETSTATPFAYEGIETIALGDDSLTLSLTVANHARHTLPYGLGLHPYFPLTPATRLFAAAGRYWSERDGHLPGVPAPVPPDADFVRGARLPAGRTMHSTAGTAWRISNGRRWAASLSSERPMASSISYSTHPHRKPIFSVSSR